MPAHTITVDDLMDHCSITVDEPSNWPVIDVELTYKTHPPEPDVGIFGVQIEVTKVIYTLDGVEFNDLQALAEAFHERVANETDETVQGIRDMISNRIDNEEAEIEE